MKLVSRFMRVIGSGLGVVLAGSLWAVVPPEAVIDDRAATLALAESLSWRDDTRAEAIALYRGWLARSPTDGDVTMALAAIEVTAGEAAAAAARLEAWAAQEDLPPAARLLLGEAFLRLERWDEVVVLAAARRGTGEGDQPAAWWRLAGHARFFAGDARGAQPFYDAWHRAAPEEGEARRYRALALAWGGRPDEARPLLAALADEDPRDADVMRALTWATDPRQADEGMVGRLEAWIAREPKNPQPRLELADWFLARGQVEAARRLFEAGQGLAPESEEARLRYARSRSRWGDFYAAEATVRAALAERPGDPVLRGDLLGLLLAMDRFDAAEALCRRWLHDTPDALEAWLGLAELQAKRHAYPAMRAAAETVLRLAPGHPLGQRRLAEAHAALGETEAARAGWLELTRHDEVAVDAWLALARLERRRGDEAAARVALREAAARDPERPAVRWLATGSDRVNTQAFLTALTTPGAEPVWRLVEWAGLYAGEGSFPAAVRCLEAALLAQPDYFPAEEPHAEFLAIAGRYEEAEEAFARLDERFPANRQIMLKRARALGWGRRYEQSLATYAAVLALNPSDPVPLLEQARVAGWAKQRARAAAHYAERWAEPVDLRLARGLVASSPVRAADEVETSWRQWAEARLAEGEYDLAADEPPFAGMESWAQAAPGLSPDGDFAGLTDWPAAWVDLRLELWADLLLQRSFWLENRAKQLAWDRRWIRAEETYGRLLATSPGNQEAWFDLSQVQAAQGLGYREHASLRQLLSLDANNALAGRALFRRERRSAPMVHVGGRWFEESGRDQLASMRWRELRLGTELMADFRHRLDLDLWRGRHQATAGARERFDSRGFDLRGATVLNEHLAANGGFTRRQFTSPRLRRRDTWNLAGWGTFTDGARVGLGWETRPEAANAFALRRGAHAQHAWLGGELPLGRRADLTGRIARLLYNDGNRGAHLWIAPAYTWTEHPRTFRTILTLEARDTDEASRYLFSPEGVLTAIVYPYWTPQDYLAAALTLLWRHDLAREFFIGAPEHWYEVRVTFNVGTDRNAGGNLEAEYVREWRDRWVLRAGLTLTRSREWDATGAHLRLGRRF